MVDPPATGPPQWLDPTGGCPLWQSSLLVYALPELEVSQQWMDSSQGNPSRRAYQWTVWAFSGRTPQLRIGDLMHRE